MPIEASGIEVVTRPVEVRVEAVPEVPLAGTRLRQVLDAPVAGLTWRNVTLRDAARQVGETFGVAVMRDRRIDPTAAVEVTVSGLALRQVLEEAARDAGGELRVVGNVAYVAPAEVARVVRTVVELRRQELEGLTDRRLAARRLSLLRGQTVRWGDLTEPAEALRLVAERFGLKVENREIVPHDLWAGAVLPEVSAAEALTLVLIQVDLTFAWGDDLASIRIVPLPRDRSSIMVERRYPVAASPGEAAAVWRERFPGLRVEVAGREVVVRGTVEQQEAIERERSDGRGPRRQVAPPEPNVVPLDRRRFTLAVSRVPAKAVMAKLEESGIRFEYDAKRLAEAGVDLGAPVTLDVKQAGAAELFGALFGPLGAAFEAEGTVVRLRPAE